MNTALGHHEGHTKFIEMLKQIFVSLHVTKQMEEYEDFGVRLFDDVVSMIDKIASHIYGYPMFTISRNETKITKDSLYDAFYSFIKNEECEPCIEIDDNVYFEDDESQTQSNGESDFSSLNEGVYNISIPLSTYVWYIDLIDSGKEKSLLRQALKVIGSNPELLFSSNNDFSDIQITSDTIVVFAPSILEARRHLVVFFRHINYDNIANITNEYNNYKLTQEDTDSIYHNEIMMMEFKGISLMKRLIEFVCSEKAVIGTLHVPICMLKHTGVIEFINNDYFKFTEDSPTPSISSISSMPTTLITAPVLSPKLWNNNCKHCGEKCSIPIVVLKNPQKHKDEFNCPHCKKVAFEYSKCENHKYPVYYFKSNNKKFDGCPKCK